MAFNYPLPLYLLQHGTAHKEQLMITTGTLRSSPPLFVWLELELSGTTPPSKSLEREREFKTARDVFCSYCTTAVVGRQDDVFFVTPWRREVFDGRMLMFERGEKERGEERSQPFFSASREAFILPQSGEALSRVSTRGAHPPPPAREHGAKRGRMSTRPPGGNHPLHS